LVIQAPVLLADGSLTPAAGIQLLLADMLSEKLKRSTSR
jgi:hypothetical protein